MRRENNQVKWGKNKSNMVKTNNVVEGRDNGIREPESRDTSPDPLHDSLLWRNFPRPAAAAAAAALAILSAVIPMEW